MPQLGQSPEDLDPNADEDSAIKTSLMSSTPRCEVCGSTDVSDAVCIEHLTCGYIASIATFEFNNFVCPRCGRKLMKEQADYQKVTMRVCHNCGHIARIREANVPKRIEEAIQVKRETTPINLNAWIDYVDNMLRRLGVKYVRDYKIRGASGVVHHWDFAVWLSKDERPEIAIKFKLTNSSKSISNSINYISDILSIAVKKADSEIPHLILLVNYEEAGTLLRTCEELGIKLVSADHKKSFTETLENLVKTINKSS